MNRSSRLLPALALSLLLPACSPAKPPASGTAAQSADAQPAAALPTTSAKTVAVALQDGAPPVPPHDHAGFVAKGIYLTATTMALPRMYTIVKAFKAVGGNTVVFDVKDEGGIVSYKSDVPMVKQIGADKGGPIVDLAKRVAWLHSQGFHVVGRLVCFHDPILAKARPDLDIHKHSGPGPWLEPQWGGTKLLDWVDPSQPEVQQYIIDLAKELSRKGVDEIQFDYIRFPAQGSLATLRDARYATFDPATTPKWRILQRFLAKVKSQIAPMMVSIDVYGIVAWDQAVDWKTTGQKLDELAPYTDAICPMDYPSLFYSAFDGKAYPPDEPYFFVNQGVAKLAKLVKGSDVTIRPWVQGFGFRVHHFGPAYVTAELKAAHDADATGWMIWNAENQYRDSFAGVADYH